MGDCSVKSASDLNPAHRCWIRYLEVVENPYCSFFVVSSYHLIAFYMPSMTMRVVKFPSCGATRKSNELVQLNLHETNLSFQYLSHHLTWHCLLISVFPQFLPVLACCDHKIVLHIKTRKVEKLHSSVNNRLGY